MFQPEVREEIRARLVAHARSDPRIVAAAMVGSTAQGGDRWSDLDLTFGVSLESTVSALLVDWTAIMANEFQAAVLFDMTVSQTVYRVFLLPGALQVDLSFAPAHEFGSRGPRFQLIFGQAMEHPNPTGVVAADQFGLGVHHLVRTHICIERGRLWQALHWLNGARDQAMLLACLRLGLDTHYGRGFDQLPETVRDGYLAAVPSHLTEDALRHALDVVTARLVDEGAGVENGERVRLILTSLDDRPTASSC